MKLSLKGKVNSTVVIVILMVLLVGLMGFLCWYSFQQSEETQKSISTLAAAYADKKVLLSQLIDLQDNSEEYIRQKEKYDAVVADEGTYTVKDQSIKMDDLCRAYNLTLVDVQVGALEDAGNHKIARTVLSVTGSEFDVKRFAVDYISKQEIARIDDIAITGQEDGTVAAVMTLVDVTK